MDLILLKKVCMYFVNFAYLIVRKKCPNTPKPKCVNNFVQIRMHRDLMQFKNPYEFCLNFGGQNALILTLPGQNMLTFVVSNLSLWNFRTFWQKIQKSLWISSIFFVCIFGTVIILSPRHNTFPHSTHFYTTCLNLSN